jgi:hypothetical protein
MQAKAKEQFNRHQAEAKAQQRALLEKHNEAKVRISYETDSEVLATGI